MEDPFSSPLARELEGHTLASYSAKHLTNEAAYQAVDVAAEAVIGMFPHQFLFICTLASLTFCTFVICKHLCYAFLGANASSVSMLFFLAYANCSGGVSKLLECTPGCAQESRIKVCLNELKFLAYPNGMPLFLFFYLRLSWCSSCMSFGITSFPVTGD